MQAVTVDPQLARAKALREAAKASHEAAEQLAQLVDAAVTDGVSLPNPLARYAWQAEFNALMAQSLASEYCLELLGVEVAQ